MQLNVTTDYAIRTVVFLALSSGITRSADISQVMGIPEKYTTALTRKLREGGIIHTLRGKHGGFSLKKSPAEISLYDIISIMEGTTHINRCLEEDHYCSRNAAEDCPVRCRYVDLELLLDNFLKGVTIQSLLE